MLSPALIIADKMRSPSGLINWHDKSFTAVITNIPPEAMFTSFFSVKPRTEILKMLQEGKSAGFDDTLWDTCEGVLISLYYNI